VKLSIVWSIVTVIGIAAAVVIGTVVVSGGITSDSTPWIGALLALIASTVPALIAMVSSLNVEEKVNNGFLAHKVAEAMNTTGVSEAVNTIHDGEIRRTEALGRGEGNGG